MVYQDISRPPQGSQSPLSSKPAILDRALSFFLDYLIFAPVVSFISLLLFYDEIQIWKKTPLGAETVSIFLNLFILFVILFSGLQTVFIYYWKATPGQYYLKLQMQFSKTPGLLLFRIFFRQIGFWISPLFGGIPWLAVLAHPQGQTFYDRMAECRLVTLKTSEKRFGFESEQKYWRSLLATLTLFLGFLFAASFWQNHQQLKNGGIAFEKLQKEDHFCAEMKSVPLKERLQMVIALNLVGHIADACVDQEVDFVLWKSTESDVKSLAYYAKSITAEDDAEEAIYLKQACVGVDERAWGCQVASAFSDSDRLQEFYQTLNSNTDENFLRSTLRYELGLLLDQGEFRQAHFEKLKSFDDQKIVKKYLISELMLKNSERQNQNRQPASAEKKQSVDRDYAQKLLRDL